MVSQIEIKMINFDNIALLEQFVENIGDSEKTFRYFKSRPLSVIANHLVTVLAVDNNMPMAYGHLDKEEDVIWLGIAVSENNKGKGLGNLVMNYLINYADQMKIKELSLSVDADNTIASNMYKKFRFQEVKILEKSNTLIMKRSY
ncbi:GNAT family N-acetyltransferase [Flavobacterium adhaerens]|uniref:GNAT family N-acetyltransferase n=1 Tax=Flavobacterium adhaerens TaxID=3149043 RepID=UPI0032B4B05A